MKQRLNLTISVSLLALLAVPTLASAQLKTVRVASAHKVTTATLPLFVGMHMKFFEEVGLKIEPSYFLGGGDTIRAITTRSADITHNAAPGATLIAISKGEPIKIVAGNTGPAGTLWVVPADSPIKSVKDLKGKKVGFSTPGSVTHVAIQQILKKEGLEKDVQLVRAGGPGDNWAAIKNKVIDAGWHVSPGVYTLIAKNEARILFHTAQYVKEYQETVIIATEEMIKRDPEIIRNYLKARAKAINFLWENPEKAIAIWAEEVKLSPDVLRLALKDTPRNYWDTGAPKPENLRAAIQEVLDLGAIKELLDPAKVVDLRFVPK
jgi:NitT/TauT family transport system substrate-binding protein